MSLESDLIAKITSLSKRRGFIFQSSEIYGGLRSAFDYGPLGAELKRNIAQEWWRCMVHEREDIVGLDASIIMHPTVWKASGHLSGFSDPLVDCKNCKERFRADKAPRVTAGTKLTYFKGGVKSSGEKIENLAGDRGYCCPVCGGQELSEERQFNLMFRTSLGPVDPLDKALDEIVGKNLSRSEMRSKLEDAVRSSAVYLRPETAQAMFVQFLNVQQSMSMKVPFGIAQIGKSFRNEITTEHFTFRSCEFEQMEMEYFCEPGTHEELFTYWVQTRMDWWRKLSNNKESYREYKYPKEELAHYSSGTSDIQFKFPWGWDELEGVASRTDFDLTAHTKESGVKLSYFDQNKLDPATGKPGWRYTPYVIEPAAGLSRAVLAFLCDAYVEEKGTDAEGAEKIRVVLKLNPRLAPIKVAILPLMKKEGMPEAGRDVVQRFYKEGISASYDEQQSIGKRYARHDEIGTPYCITIDHQTLTDNTVTIRDRDTTKQDRIPIAQALEIVKARLRNA
jgi:glycyl-tRNA synthetase